MHLSQNIIWMVRLLAIFYLLLQFSRFLQTFFCKMLIRGLSTICTDRFLNFCLQKIWHTDQVGVLKKIQPFSEHQLGQCAKFFVGTNSKIRFEQILDKPLTSILQKSVCKNLENCKSRQENGETLPNLGLPSGKPARGQLIIFFFFLGPLLTYLKELHIYLF